MPSDNDWKQLLLNWKIIRTLGGSALGVVATLALLKKLNILAPRRTIKYTISFDEQCYGGRIFGEALKTQGVKYLFTLTGGHIAPILVGAKEMGITVIDVRHEVNTVFAADAMSRITGIPGVAVVTAGPGLTNTITAVKNAQMAQSPIILIGGATSDLLKGKGSLQDIDQISLIKPHVKWYTHINTVLDIVPAVENAFRIAQEGVPGPVFIEVPLDTLYKEKTTREFYSKVTGNKSSLIARLQSWYVGRHLNNLFSANEISFGLPLVFNIPTYSSRQLNNALSLVASSKKPVVMIGSQSMLQTQLVSSGKLTTLINESGIPIFLTGMARGLLGSDSKVQLRHKETRRKALREADVVILAGVPCDFRLDYGNNISRRAKLISINRSYEDLTKNRKPDLAINADPATFLAEFADKIGRNQNNLWSHWLQELSLVETASDQKIETDSKAKGELISPIYLCKEIERIAGPNAIFIADGGDFVGTAAYILKPRGPLTWMDPGVFGTLGVGCGFAMGAKLAKPDSEVWIIFGDGACGFSLIEFDTFVRHNIPVIAVVGNDAAWSQILRDQVTFLGDSVGSILAPTDYHIAAKGLGAEGILIRDNSEVEEALVKARELAKKKPVLINAIIRKTDFRAGSLSM